MSKLPLQEKTADINIASMIPHSSPKPSPLEPLELLSAAKPAKSKENSSQKEESPQFKTLDQIQEELINTAEKMSRDNRQEHLAHLEGLKINTVLFQQENYPPNENLDQEFLGKRSHQKLLEKKRNHSNFKEGLLSTLASGKKSKFKVKKCIPNKDKCYSLKVINKDQEARDNEWRLKNSNKRLDRIKKMSGFDSTPFMSDCSKRMSVLEKEQHELKETTSKEVKSKKCYLESSNKRLKVRSSFQSDLASVLSKSIKKRTKLELEKDELQKQKETQAKGGSGGRQTTSVKSPNSSSIGKSDKRGVGNSAGLRSEEIPLKVDPKYIQEVNEIAVTLEDKFDKAFKVKNRAVCSACGQPLFNSLTPQKTKSFRCRHKLHLVSKFLHFHHNLSLKSYICICLLIRTAFPIISREKASQQNVRTV